MLKDAVLMLRGMSINSVFEVVISFCSLPAVIRGYSSPQIQFLGKVCMFGSENVISICYTHYFYHSTANRLRLLNERQVEKGRKGRIPAFFAESESTAFGLLIRENTCIDVHQCYHC